MSPEEKPPENLDFDSHPSPLDESTEFESPNATGSHSVASSMASQLDSGEPIDAPIVKVYADAESAHVDAAGSADPVMAEIAHPNLPVHPAGEELLSQNQLLSIPLPSIAGNLENMSANGGAIGSLVLGLWCVAGSFITNWSMINGVIGLLMGFWGLTSRKQRTAWIGIALCFIGIFMSLVQVNELINTYLNTVDETPY